METFNCKKCRAKIGKHNQCWHEGMCDDCFFETYFPGENRTVLFKVDYLGPCGSGFERKVSREIELKESQSLDDLQDAIICKSFKWDDPHLYSFFLDNKAYSGNKEMRYSNDPEEKTANSSEILLGELSLKKSQKFLFVFDYGDNHYFRINVRGFGKWRTKDKYPVMLKEEGKAPKQYPPCKG